MAWIVTPANAIDRRLFPGSGEQRRPLSLPNHLWGVLILHRQHRLDPDAHQLRGRPHLRLGPEEIERLQHGGRGLALGDPVQFLAPKTRFHVIFPAV